MERPIATTHTPNFKATVTKVNDRRYRLRWDDHVVNEWSEDYPTERIAMLRLADLITVTTEDRMLDTDERGFVNKVDLHDSYRPAVTALRAAFPTIANDIWTEYVGGCTVISITFPDNTYIWADDEVDGQAWAVLYERPNDNGVWGDQTVVEGFPKGLKMSDPTAIAFLIQTVAERLADIAAANEGDDSYVIALPVGFSVSDEGAVSLTVDLAGATEHEQYEDERRPSARTLKAVTDALSGLNFEIEGWVPGLGFRGTRQEAK